jgi:hypothetical protein
MPKITVPPASDVAKKWGDVTPGRAGYYESKTPAASGKWETNTSEASGNYKASIQSPSIQQLFAGGVKKAGGAKFARKVKDVGVARFGPGVTAAVSDMQTGVAPFLDELSKVEIPARGPRGSAGNYAIVQKVGDPLHKRRLAELGAAAGAT